MRREVDAAVRALVVLRGAAATIARDSSLVAPLAESTGLSPAGVALALSSLELDATDAELEALAERATPAPEVHVVLSATVFTGAFRALAVARACSAKVTVRPSRRSPTFVRALVGASKGAGVSLAEAREIEDVRNGEIHVYGRDETVVAVRGRARAGVVVRGHGAGLGVALVTAAADLGEAGRLVADDVVVFDQRGCLSPRVVIVIGNSSRLEAFARQVHGRLEDLGRSVPRGALRDEERALVSRYAETMAFTGHTLRGEGHLVGVAQEPTPVVVPPAGRHVHVMGVRNIAVARSALSPIAKWVVAVGCDDESVGLALFDTRHRVRVSPLGWMQRPRLDGPVDLR